MTHSHAKSDQPEVLLFTDGACSGNPGPGGWAYLMRHVASGTETEDSGGERSTTNNRMELTAAIRGLQALKKPTRVRLISDSQYVTKGLTEWMDGWKKKGWRRGKDPLANVEMWQELDRLRQMHTITCEWVRGHNDHPENERCDQLAVAAYQQFLS